MGMVAILVMWPKPCEQAFISPFQEGLIWNSASIGLVVIE